MQREAALDSSKIERRVAECVDACCRQGAKATHQRTEILRELIATPEHPDAQITSDRVRQRIPPSRWTRYHFVCCECGMIGDFYSDVLDRLPVPCEVAETSTMASVYVKLRGHCAKCQTGAKNCNMH